MERLVKSKLGVSVMIGYVLLVSLAVIMGGAIYIWMKSYVPQESISCPDGSAIAIKEYNYSCSSNENITFVLKNNGRFALAGYFIHVSNKTDQKIANIDLSKYEYSGDFMKFQTAFVMGIGNENGFAPGDETINIFNWSSSGVGEIYSMEILPVRWQKDDNNKIRLVSCGDDSVAEESVSCT